jgi:hypothetical protein
MEDTQMDKPYVKHILNEMHQIINPGEYGLGDQPESIPNDKKAWERLSYLLDKLMKEVQ